VASAFSGYHFTAQDDLTEAAAGVRQLGSKCIKLWFTKLSEAYPHTNWPVVSNLTEMAKTAPFDKVFHQDFTTYILETYSVGLEHFYWREDPTSEHFREDERQIYDLTCYLLSKYRDTGKTFVLQ